jgi:hypothetical protein
MIYDLLDRIRYVMFIALLLLGQQDDEARAPPRARPKPPLGFARAAGLKALSGWSHPLMREQLSNSHIQEGCAHRPIGRTPHPPPLLHEGTHRP